MNSTKTLRVPAPRWALALAVAALALPASASAASTRYAEPSGDGPAATCPEADPCSLEAAIEDPSVTWGDEVVVKAGDYSFDDPLVIDDVITVRAEAGSRPELLSFGDDYVSVGPGAALRGLEIAHYGGDTGLLVKSGAIVEQVSALGEPGATCQLQGGVLRDSVCANSKGLGRAVLMAVVGANASGKLRNVTAVGRVAGTVGVEVQAINDQVTLDARNVIASGDMADVRTETFGAAGLAAVDLDHSNYEITATNGPGTETISTPGSADNQTENPVFVNAAIGDFHQAANSPTVNAGSASASDLGSADLDGEARIDGSAPDIGADELPEDDPPPPPPPPPPPGDDTVAPETTIDAGPPAKVKTRKRKTKVTVGFSANEEAATFECSLDGGAYSPCASPFGLKVAKGRHTLAVRATDAAGNTDESPAEVSWKVKKRRR